MAAAVATLALKEDTQNPKETLVSIYCGLWSILSCDVVKAVTDNVLLYSVSINQ